MAWAATFAYLAIIVFLGWRAGRGGDTEKVMFVVNTVLLWLSAIWLFGYPALIGPAVVAAGGILLLLVVMTSSDLLVRAPREQDGNSVKTEGAAGRTVATEKAKPLPAAAAKAPAADGPVRSATASS
ncbi:hypothetical protein [Hoeflea sp. BAL378]|uniref:hypothetical protein n=1 Tax=Hoeflea sp. BAL378 TaxID=1547437 RepID=UPI00068DA2BD|nr:hypothetical protein [Hoeflea sp. BAL378]